MTLGKRKDTGILRRSTASHSLENSLWKRLVTCGHTNYGMN
jgi:hypothetical protein